jgi:hypothetical protein
MPIARLLALLLVTIPEDERTITMNTTWNAPINCGGRTMHGLTWRGAPCQRIARASPMAAKGSSRH